MLTVYWAWMTCVGSCSLRVIPAVARMSNIVAIRIQITVNKPLRDNVGATRLDICVYGWIP